jgi:hypothetical protein|tara:strand:- start:150 stop:311 length:162 start_codon:yes stop_codon:yes gene_type:complete
MPSVCSSDEGFREYFSCQTPFPQIQSDVILSLLQQLLRLRLEQAWRSGRLSIR